MADDELTKKIIGVSIEVHRELGPGLLESAYRECLVHGLRAAGLNVEKEKPMPIIFRGIKLDHGYRIDILVEDRVVIEIKTVEALTDVHLAQILTYLRLGNFRIGLLINFHEKLLKNGLRRVVNG